jgi:hypothetical protein
LRAPFHRERSERAESPSFTPFCHNPPQAPFRRERSELAKHPTDNSPLKKVPPNSFIRIQKIVPLLSLFCNLKNTAYE